MYPTEVRADVARLHASGSTVSAIARTIGVNRSTVRAWLAKPGRPVDQRCFVCTGGPPVDTSTYLYLFGQYLGDGYIPMMARVPRLRIACADDYPGIAAEVDAALAELSGNKVHVVHGVGCSDRSAYWMHWPCLFPQVGPGPKHSRPIVLTPWQTAWAASNPWPLLRGLIHSDGCRTVNRIVHPNRRYEYPRYHFSNSSTDIMRICTDALDAAGVAWSMCTAKQLSIARRDAVAAMDAHIGPKY